MVWESSHSGHALSGGPEDLNLIRKKDRKYLRSFLMLRIFPLRYTVTIDGTGLEAIVQRQVVHAT
jgi:hypothetical protein